ncbi:wound-induced protein 1-like [Euphorbia lathyris]|uniref:wound-induced protein 1-like n=1 Tax=Euphorbia lathyris TaxID=212925 RepID=UPI003313D213
MSASEMEQRQMKNKGVVDALYKGLGEGKMETVGKLVASELEWWFHGPPKCQHMMRILTGEARLNAFRFEPKSVEGVGDCVIAEGWEGEKVYWVHVWTIKNDGGGGGGGVIIQFREYFNTWLTVRDINPHPHHHAHTVWQSHPRDLFTRSLPALVLAI